MAVRPVWKSHTFKLLGGFWLAMYTISFGGMNSRAATTLRTFPKILAWCALLVWFGFIYLFLQYDATRPTVPQRAEGRVYASNNHGHITYLNDSEEDRLHLLEFGALGLFLIASVTDHFQRNPQQLGEIHVMATRAAYDILSPVSWYAAGTRLARAFKPTRIRSAARVLVDQKRICLVSDESVPNCQARLEGAVGFNTVGPILGEVRGSKFRLHILRKDFRNSFAPHFHGELRAAPSGTTIEGKFTMHFFVRMFLTIWFAGVIGIGGKMALVSAESIATGRPVEHVYIGLFFPTALLFAGILIVYSGKTLGVDDEAQILKFLQHRLNCRPLQAGRK